jgi:phosphate starvation-inducible protein PhoH and related proteins
MTDYNRTPEAQETFKEKRKPKGPIKFKLSLNEEQKQAKELILSKPVTLIEGKAGSGKTTLASQIALDLLFRREIEQVLIARPFVTAGEDIGFLPGGVDQKLEYLTFPIYDLMNTMTGDPDKITKIQSENKIKVMPIGFLRGHTFTDSMIIIDEAQNLTKKQTELILGRLGNTSRIVFCGDKPQCDLKNKLDSGINLLYDLSKNIPNVGYVKLLQNHRHPIVDEILSYIKENGL